MNDQIRKVFRLIGNLQHYAWGGYSFLPELLHIENPGHDPFAEYWLGAHGKASARIETDNGTENLRDQIFAAKEKILGVSVSTHFGHLPYLLKILDVRDMLSIQVHPSKSAAEAEYERENRLGIPIDAPHRNYKDDNHKPELMVALGDFWLLHGFKPKDHLRSILNDRRAFRFLLPAFGEGDYLKLFKTFMQLDQSSVNNILEPLLEEIIPLYMAGRLDKNKEDFWAARAALAFNEPGRIDRGIFCIYLLNLVHLEKGQAVYQDAGLLHAYLEGQNVEIMANSDNVLRGGLTSKHVDVQALLKHIRFDATVPSIFDGKKKNRNEIVFTTPAKDFELSCIELTKSDKQEFQANSIEIFFVMEGAVGVEEKYRESIHLERGEAFVAFDRATFDLSTDNYAKVFHAVVPR